MNHERYLERLELWLRANDISATLNEIPQDSFNVNEYWIEYETYRNGIRSGLHMVPHKVKWSTFDSHSAHD